MEQIGLKAVMEMAGFTQGINKYNDMLGGASSNTDKQAGLMSKALAGIGTVLKTGVAVAAGGIAALVSTITGAAVATVSWAEKLDGVGDVLGTTTQQSAALAVAAQHLGLDVNSVVSPLAIMAKGLETVDGKLGPTGKALKDLGISFKDASGKIRPATDILQDVADKVGIMPDGLEKTQLMMQVFGKSGKEMSDLLGAIANGGMDKFDQMAKGMGLSMSQDAVDGAVEFNRSINDLKMQFQGFLVQVGSKAMPMLKTLISTFQIIGDNVLPIFVNALKPLVEFLGKVAFAIDDLINETLAWQNPLDGITVWVGRFFGLDAEMKFYNLAQSVQTVAGQARDFLLPILQQVGDFIQNSVVPIIGKLADWIGRQIPIVIGIISNIIKNDLIPAFDGIVKFITEQVVPAVAVLIDYFTEHVIPMWEKILPPILHILAEIFTKVLLPALSGIFTFVRESLIPIMGQVADWLAENVPIAIQKATDIWNNTLLPALKDVWEFIKEKVIPIISDVITWLATNIPPAIETAVKFIKESLIPAFKDIWVFIRDKVIPIIGDVVTWLAENIPPAIQTAVKFFKENLYPALYDIWEFMYNKVLPIIKDIVGWLLDNIPRAVEWARKAWEDVLLPALRSVWSFITEKLIPAISEIVTWFRDKIAGPIGSVVSGALTNLRNIFIDIKGAISDVIGFLKQVVEWANTAIAKLQELLGLQGQSTEQGDADSPGRTPGPKSDFAGAGIGGGSKGGGMAIYNNRTVNIYMNNTMNNGMDAASFRAEVLSIVTEAIGA